MENFKENYERQLVDGKTKFRYPIPGNPDLPSWMRGIENLLRQGADKPTSRFMTPAEINKIRRQQGEQPYSRSEFETFGIEPAGPRRVPLKGYDEPVKPNEPARPVEPAKPNEPARPVEPAKPNEPARPTEPTEPVKPVEPSQPTPKVYDKEEGMKKWAQNFPELAKRVVKKQQRATMLGRGITQSGYDTIKKELSRAGTNMEAYDVVLDYLLSEGHADTVEEAHYVMMQMDAKHIQSIIAEN